MKGRCRMSATNRGAKREDSDFYPTPLVTIEQFLNVHKIQDGIILEPCAGNGNFISVLRKLGYTNEIVANELREEENDNLINVGADYVHHVDFLNDKLPNYNVKTIITNPPFSHAKEFIERSLELYPNAEIIMLLRLAFLESKSRHEFWQNNSLSKLYVLSQRPKFINNKSDATAYAFFVFSNKKTNDIAVI